MAVSSGYIISVCLPGIAWRRASATWEARSALPKHFNDIVCHCRPAELLDRVVLDTHLYQAFNTNDIASQGEPPPRSLAQSPACSLGARRITATVSHNSTMHVIFEFCTSRSTLSPGRGQSTLPRPGQAPAALPRAKSRLQCVLTVRRGRHSIHGAQSFHGHGYNPPQIRNDVLFSTCAYPVSFPDDTRSTRLR